MSSTGETAASSSAPRALRPTLNVERVRDYGIVLALVVLFVVLSIASPHFLTKTNLLNILEQWAPVGVMALGGTVVVIAGGFDLSIGAMYTLAGILAVAVSNHTSPVVGVIAGIGAGAAMGVINGLLGTVGRMNVFVATLGTSIVFSGLAAATTGGLVQSASDQGFGFIANDALGVNLAIWVFLAFTIMCSFILVRMAIGRYVYAIGGNETASSLAGVRVYLTRIFAFALSGIGGGVAAVLVASSSLSADSNAGNTIAFNVWTAILLGGNSMLGGEGAVWRTIVGVLLLALIGNGFDLLGLNPLYQQVATGAILLAAIGLDAWTRKKRT